MYDSGHKQPSEPRVDCTFSHLWPSSFSSHRKQENKPPEMTLERAVNLLTQDNEETLICAASHIQNQCFKSADAKKMASVSHHFPFKIEFLDVTHVKHNFCLAAISAALLFRFTISVGLESSCSSSRATMRRYNVSPLERCATSCTRVTKTRWR